MVFLDQTKNRQKIYEIHARTNAVSKSGRYNLTLTFNRKRIIELNCSCPVGFECKHQCALMLHICRQKKQVQA
jgi:uncharacterized Zn finger protein